MCQTVAQRRPVYTALLYYSDFILATCLCRLDNHAVVSWSLALLEVGWCGLQEQGLGDEEQTNTKKVCTTEDNRQNPDATNVCTAD